MVVWQGWNIDYYVSYYIVKSIYVLNVCPKLSNDKSALNHTFIFTFNGGIDHIVIILVYF